jgi:hypothetical protein
MPRQRPSYAWSQATEVANVTPAQLPDRAYRGLEYAQQLADSARTNRLQNLRHYTLEFAPPTIADIAETEGVPITAIRRRIAQARRALFGTLNDNAIQRRRQRLARDEDKPARACPEEGCGRALPADAHRNRRYCDRHRTPAARTRRSRQKRERPGAQRHAAETSRNLVSCGGYVGCYG